jgi:hypothetical protein
MEFKIIATEKAKIIVNAKMIEEINASTILTPNEDQSFIRVSAVTFLGRDKVLSNINSFFWDVANNVNVEPEELAEYCDNEIISQLEKIGYIIKSL